MIQLSRSVVKFFPKNDNQHTRPEGDYQRLETYPTSKEHIRTARDCLSGGRTPVSWLLGCLHFSNSTKFFLQHNRYSLLNLKIVY